MTKALYYIKQLSHCIILILIPILLQSCSGYNNTISASYGNSTSFNNTTIDYSGAVIILETSDPKTDSVAVDPENLLLLKVQVKDHYGSSIEGVRVKLELNGISRSDSPLANNDTTSDSPSKIFGEIITDEGLSGPGGVFYTAYSPPETLDNNLSKIKITACIEGAEISSSLIIRLVPVPVVLVHGYQATYDIFSGLASYLQIQGFTTLGFEYNSRAGVAAGAVELSRYLAEKKQELAASGIQTERFDIISHSMGGLVARYYTCSKEYIQYSNVRKLIFISVPQKGSDFAALGQKYFNDASVRDMSSDSDLFSFVLPEMINGGINPSIQTAAILGMYDEVVSASGADLTDWGINTEIYEVGESNLTVEKLLTGEILEAKNHKLILYNGKIFKRIVEMLNTTLPFPNTIN